MPVDPNALATWANAITTLRLLLSPLMIWLIPDGGAGSWVAFALWFVLCSSDAVDGHLARKHGTTKSGAFLDPLADKVLVLGGIFVMCSQGRFPRIALVLIAVREAAISVFRSVYARRGLAIQASKLAKWKAFIQLAAVGWVTLPWTNDYHWIADTTLWVGVVIGLISGAQYFIAGGRAATTMAR